MPDTTTFARAYLITEQQFADVYHQEMYRPPGTDLDFGEVLRNGRSTLGNDRYETLVHLDDLDGYPMLTFTAPWSYGDEPLVAPSGPYLRMLGHGLLSTHGWTLRQTADYLADLPGAADVWSPDEIIPMLYPYIVLSCAMTADDHSDRFDEQLTSTIDDDAAPLVQAHAPADIRRVLHELAEDHGIRRLTLKGNLATYARVLANKLIDELQLVIDSRFIADRGTPQPDGNDTSPTMLLTDARQSDDLLLRYTIKRWDIRKHPGQSSRPAGPSRATRLRGTTDDLRT